MFDLSRRILSFLSLKYITYTVTGSVAVYGVSTYLSHKPVENEQTIEKEVEIADNQTDVKKTQRRPSSTNVTHAIQSENRRSIYSPTPRLAAKNESNYVSTNANSGKEENEDDDSAYRNMASESRAGNPPPSAPIGFNQGVTNSFDPVQDEPVRENTREVSSEGPKSKMASIFETVSQGIASIPKMIVGNKTDSDSKSETSTTNTPTTSTGGSTAPAPMASNTCSSNIIGGSFGNPLGVTINCTYSSQIKYCLAKDVCCDPDSQGVPYSSKIIVGKKDGTYCLSFYGTSDSAGTSTIVQQNYTINSTLPNLSVGTPKTYFQTTELSENTFVTSLDFGKPNHMIGQINMQTHDPGSADCAEIVESDHSMLSPMPLDILSLFDVSTATASTQVEIPLRPDLLSYGENFVTSFIKNNDFEAPLYSCSTSVITLEDFPYFQIDNSQAELGDNSVREFEGQFTAYGFFEEDSNVYRGPAGVSSETKTTSSLKSGMLGIFY